MKAILVIDVDEKDLNNDVIMIELANNTQYYCNKRLKPMPQKKKIKEIKHLKEFVDIETQYDYIANKIVGKINYDVETIFNNGYNSCIDEIY